MTPKAQTAPFWEQHGQAAPSRPIKLAPQQQQAAHLMEQAAVLVKFRQFPAAAPVLQQAVKLWPTNAEIQFHCGSVLLEIGQHEDAIKHFDVALGLRPKWSEAWNNKSAALTRMGQPDEALAAAERAVACGPNYAAMANLCAAYSAQGDNEKAIAYGEQAVRTSQGANPMALINYGVSLRAVWRLDEAAGAQQRAIQVSQGQDYMAWSNLGAIYNLQGRNHEALEVTQRAVELQPQNAALYGNMVMFADLLPETTLLEALHRRRHFSYQFEAPLKRSWRPHENDRSLDRKLRVGYVGADFRQHSAAHIFGAVIRAHDPDQIAAYVFAGNRYEDAMSARIREAPALAEWVNTSSLPDHLLAEKIREDRIDILFDLASFTAGGRLLTFAMKPAPVQITGWGYATGTGLDAMDFFLTDEVQVPPELEIGYSESILRMPSLLTFDPCIELPPPGPPPATKEGHVTFGSYNRVEKISEITLRMWAEVLRRVEGSTLILKFGGLEGETAQKLRDGFSRLGVDPERIITRGHTPRDEHLRQYGDIDIMLDTFPHVGGITTLEAMMMGVPCVTLIGPRAPSRVSASFLHQLGMPEWVATTPEQYVEIAVQQAQADLSGLRAALPDRIRASWIGDTVRYTRLLEEKYREAFATWAQHVAPFRAEAAA